MNLKDLEDFEGVDMDDGFDRFGIKRKTYPDENVDE